MVTAAAMFVVVLVVQRDSMGPDELSGTNLLVRLRLQSVQLQVNNSETPQARRRSMEAPRSPDQGRGK